MAESRITASDFLELPPRVSEWRRFRRVFFSRGVVVFGLVTLLLLVLTAIFAAWLAPYDPYQPVPEYSLAQPGKEHLLGADLLGRDTLSRLIYGSRTALAVGFISVGIASIIGIPLGIIAGYTGGITNAVIMRAMDSLMCFPMLLLSLVIAAVLGNGIHNVIIALSIATIPGYARVTHGLTLSIKENDYILSQWAMHVPCLSIFYPMPSRLSSC
jgi:ABC-type dipeptide/oligopeptide/nickel transport system permease subunit